MTQFRAITSTTQAISATTETEVNYGTEVFDTDAAFASNRLTVPVGWNGIYGEFFAGVRFSTSETGYFAIQVSTDGGSVWGYVARTWLQNTSSSSVSTGPVLLNTGDIYRVVTYGSNTQTINVDTRCFFAGRQVGISMTDIRYFRATNSTTQAISPSTATTVTLGTEDFDTETAFASSTFTVPAGFNAKWAVLTGGVESTTGNTFSIYIQKSTDGGSTYPTYDVSRVVQSGLGITISTGPILLVTGHKYQLMAFDTGTLNLVNSPAVFLSGEMYKT